MLTRLKVSGFKNLVDVDVSFGPFTCIAGPNGVGKSNLFDAITFLSALADRPLLEAALSVREGGRTTDVRSLFHRIGDNYSNKITFDAEMIIPRDGKDDLGQTAKATITFLRYTLELGYRADDPTGTLGRLEILNEELDYISLGDAARRLPFKHRPNWRKSAVVGRRTSKFISKGSHGGVIQLHQDHKDGKGGGRPRHMLAKQLPRTVLSSANAAESPTVLLARREMQSWRLLQLEPSALREPDKFTDPPHIDADGSHLPSTLYHLARPPAEGSKLDDRLRRARAAEKVYATIANRLAQLIADVRGVRIDRDEKRELLTLQLTDRSGTTHAARSLSDGTLRFLALAVLEQDPETRGLLCLEEPENGINPSRIPAMVSLLQDLCVDVDEPIGDDNPLRQVIINTHSPSVVSQVPDDSLLVALSEVAVRDGRSFEQARFAWLSNTWRAQLNKKINPIAKGTLRTYLNPLDNIESPAAQGRRNGRRRVIDRIDVQTSFGFGSNLPTAEG